MYRCIDCDREAAPRALHCCYRCYEVTEQAHETIGRPAYHTKECNERQRVVADANS